MMQTYYMIWCEGGAGPTVGHPDYKAAVAEAERLAVKCPGKTFTILEAKESIIGEVQVRGFKRSIPYEERLHGKLY